MSDRTAYPAFKSVLYEQHFQTIRCSAPSEKKLKNLLSGDLVQVCKNQAAFYDLQVLSVDNVRRTIMCSIEEDMTDSKDNELKRDDVVFISYDHVFKITKK